MVYHCTTCLLHLRGAYMLTPHNIYMGDAGLRCTTHHTLHLPAAVTYTTHRYLPFYHRTYYRAFLRGSHATPFLHHYTFPASLPLPPLLRFFAQFLSLHTGSGRQKKKKKNRHHLPACLVPA